MVEQGQIDNPVLYLPESVATLNTFEDGSNSEYYYVKHPDNF